MTSKELRVGNWVNDRGSQPYQVTATDIVALSLSEQKEKINIDFNSIPLTEEWLLKFGAERISDRLQLYFRAIDTSIVIEYYPENMENCSDTYRGKCFLWINGTEFCIKEIKFVHDLQNTWKELTQKELSIQTS